MKIKLNENIVGIGIVIIVASVMMAKIEGLPIRLEDCLCIGIVLLGSILISILCENWDNLFNNKKEVI